MKSPMQLLYARRWTTQDAVHDYIILPGIARFVIDHPIFQRMREIKQLGASSYVYPGALHNRFCHSIGTGFLAMEVLKQLERYNSSSFEFKVKDIVCCLVAALCHDLGHPAFSHMVYPNIVCISITCVTDCFCVLVAPFHFFE
jgi:HD superfamily phosphohydrolase